MVDKAWVDAVETRAAKRKEMLESELAGYKTNAIKESIRMGLVDLGDFHRARGDAANAFKAYARTRDYCTTNRHVVSTCLNVVRVGVESGNFAHVQTYCASRRRRRRRRERGRQRRRRQERRLYLPRGPLEQRVGRRGRGGSVRFG